MNRESCPPNWSSCAAHARPDRPRGRLPTAPARSEQRPADLARSRGTVPAWHQLVRAACRGSSLVQFRRVADARLASRAPADGLPADAATTPAAAGAAGAAERVSACSPMASRARLDGPRRRRSPTKFARLKCRQPARNKITPAVAVRRRVRCRLQKRPPGADQVNEPAVSLLCRHRDRARPGSRAARPVPRPRPRGTARRSGVHGHRGAAPGRERRAPAQRPLLLRGDPLRVPRPTGAVSPGGLVIRRHGGPWARGQMIG